MLTAAFYIIPGARHIPPLFKGTAAILLSLINMVAWNRDPSPASISTREALKILATIGGLITFFVVVDTTVGFLFGGKSILDAFLFHSGGMGGPLDCVLIAGGLFVGIPTLIRSMLL